LRRAVATTRRLGAGSNIEVWIIPSRSEPQPESSYADDPMSPLCQNADDRETGAEGEAIRARRKNLGPNDKRKKLTPT